MKILNISALILCSILLCNCKKSSTADLITIDPVPVVLPEITKTFDIAYGTLHAAQKVDVYTPKAVAPFPVVVLIHGGGWVQGDKQEYRTSQKTEALLAKGYAVVAVNYRLSGVAKFPAQIQDVKAAVRWIRANATTYKFNPDKIGAWGTSAGGHLTALLATSGGINALEDLTQGDATKSSTIQAAVDWFGPTDFLQMDAQTIAQGCGANNATHNLASSPESSLMGYAIQTQPTLVQVANPITYVTSNDPPMYIAHGLGDCTVPRVQGQILYDALFAAKGATDIKINMLTASGHGTGQFEDVAFVNVMVDFFDKYLK
jgi:acetyl esterase/lipase